MTRRAREDRRRVRRRAVLRGNRTVHAGDAAESAFARPPPRNLEEFDKAFNEHSNWGRWGKDDEQRGPEPRHTSQDTPGNRTRLGTVCPSLLAHIPIAGGDLPDSPGAGADSPGQGFAHVMWPGFMSDSFRFDYHGYVTSHIDALCHFQYRGMLYSGIHLRADNTAKWCRKLGIETLKNGVITRAILIAIPRLKGVPYLEADY